MKETPCTADLPETWKVARLGSLVDVLGGSTPSKNEPSYWDGDVPWVSPKDMKVFRLTDTGDHITQLALRETSLKLLPPGAVLMVTRGMILLRTVPIALNEVPVTLNQDMKALLPRQGVSPEFLAWSLVGLNPALLARVEEAGHGTRALRTEQWRVFPMGLPCPKEQATISAFLDQKIAAIDALITKKERLIELLQENRQALITQAVTKGLDPKVPMKDSGIEWLGEIPKHWRVLPIKRIFDVSYGLGGEIDRTVDEGTKVISLPNVTFHGSLDVSDVSLRPLTHQERQEALLRKGDLLFNWRNGSVSHVGKTALFDLEGEYAHVSFLLKLRPRLGLAESAFYWMVLNGLRASGFFASSKFQVNVTYNQTELRRVPVPCPPLDEQRQIAEVIMSKSRKLDGGVERLWDSIEKLREYRQALISAVVTGQLDISQEVAKEVEEEVH